MNFIFSRLVVYEFHIFMTGFAAEPVSKLYNIDFTKLQFFFFLLF